MDLFPKPPSINQIINSLDTWPNLVREEFGQRAINVKWFGAKGDGVTDDTAAVQAAINAAISDGGGIIFIPEGTFVVNSLVSDTNIALVGAGWSSILKQKSGAQYCVSVNPGDGGTPDPATNKHSIMFYNLQFLGTVDVDGFSEHVHLLNLNAVSDVIINKCKFKGWRGDAIYIGSGNVAGIERHNKRITISECTFDGVNNDNRQAISVIDCEGLTVDRCNFRNCTRPNKPGAIDMEPDANAFAVIRDIRITNNKFENIGGNVGVIALLLPLGQASLTNPSKRIIIENNVIDGTWTSGRTAGIFLKQVQDATDSTEPNDIVVANNFVKRTTRPFQFLGVKGVKVIGNIFEDSRSAALVSYTGIDKCQDIEFIGNTFRKLTNISGEGGIAVFDVDRISFINNIFDNIGKSDGTSGYAIDFHNGTVDWVRIENNLFMGALTTVAIQKEASNVNYPDHNRIVGNIFLNDNRVFLPANTYKDRKAVKWDTAAPTVGTWRRGDIVYNIAPAAGGKIGWVCVADGTPGTWKAFGAIDA